MNEPRRPDQDEIRTRQRSRSIVMAIGLALFAVLMFAITVVRMGMKAS